MTPDGRRAYVAISLVLALVFALVGAIFLLYPAGVQAAFDRLAPAIGLEAGRVGEGLFRALAVAYMAVVTALAWLMARRPAEPVFPLLLALAKLASSGLSLALFFAEAKALVFLGNGIVDGAIGAFALAAGLALRRAASRPGP